MVSIAGGRPRPAPVADWVELQVLFGENSVVSRSEILTRLREDASLDDLALFDEEYGDLATWDEEEARHDLRLLEAEGNDEASRLVEDTMLTLQHRADTVGDRYPLEVTAQGVRLRESRASWRDAWGYAFMALLGARLARRTPKETVDTTYPARLFERLVAHALQAYWNGDARHIGFPRDDASGFRDELVSLAHTLGEAMAVRRSGIPEGIKDLAADVVAWRRLDDRAGNAVLFCQCAIGGDWDSKAVPRHAWESLINFAVPPLIATAFPMVPDAVRPFDGGEWQVLCGVVGIPFDRLRLASLLDESTAPSGLREEIIGWTAQFHVHLLE